MKVQMFINAATIAALIWFRDDATVVGAISVVTTIVIGVVECCLSCPDAEEKVVSDKLREKIAGLEAYIERDLIRATRR